MQITIEVPEMKCAKCAAAAPILPHLLFSKGQTPVRFRDVLSPLMRMQADAIATDGNTGQVWGVLADDKPAGWVKGPQDSDLCADCGAAWLEAGKAFLAPTPVAVQVVERTYADAAPVKPAALPPMPSMAYGSFTPTPMRRQY